MSFFVRGIVLAALMASFMAEPATAQSFDCNDAYTPDEILICDRPGLSKLDRELNRLYREKLDEAPKFLRYMIREEQAAWLRSRNRCRRDARCVRVHYRARHRELEAVLRRGKKPDPEPPAQPGCTVFRDPGYKGEQALINPNVQLAFFSGGWNNKISSVKVSNNCQLVAYQNSLFRGASRTFSQSTRSLGPNWNNKISSLECPCR